MRITAENDSFRHTLLIGGGGGCKHAFGLIYYVLNFFPFDIDHIKVMQYEDLVLMKLSTEHILRDSKTFPWVVTEISQKTIHDANWCIACILPHLIWYSWQLADLGSVCVFIYVCSFLPLRFYTNATQTIINTRCFCKAVYSTPPAQSVHYLFHTALWKAER